MLFKTKRFLKIAQIIVVGLVIIFLLTSCHNRGYKKHWWEFWKPKKPAVAAMEEEVPPPTTAQPPISGSRVEGAEGIPLAQPERREASGSIGPLKTVYFDYDSSELSGEAKQILEGDAAWIKENASGDLQIQIEGHCDERGTIEYNYNLGQRRADAVREYLVQLNVSPDILHTISYGEDRPVIMGHDEEAWRQNRRAQFLVY